MEQSILTAVQESAEGIVGLPAGEASEALQAERRREQICRAGNREFFNQFSMGQGDYTKEREKWLGDISLDEAISQIKSHGENA